ncbi:MAG: carbamoyltransferase HypF [Hydrogenimonas sp.]|nr:carbamoyltransferase HypF [Hydrogenimonas sp.]
MRVRYRLKIKGVVQGVGFRPTLYKYAIEHEAAGYVKNSSEGVIAEIEGDEESINALLYKIENCPPKLARIDRIDIEPIKPLFENEFKILSSKKDGSKSTPISADISVCDRCLSEMRDPANRRYLYPFINCTDCGPRYTITHTVPYDRPNTSMASFKMCKECEKEYKDPSSRRYHAQPIACDKCGPQTILKAKGLTLKGHEAIKECANLLAEGKIVAIKGIGGFHLMCNASKTESVKLLRERKKRASKPFAVMVKNLQMAKSLATISQIEEDLLTSKERPIVLLKKSSKELEGIAPQIDIIGIMLPYTPLHYLLFDYIDFPLVATSANISEEPIIFTYEELAQKLAGVVDAVLDHNREIVNACDDSVAHIVENRVQWLRVARGIAPVTIPLSFKSDKKILAVGANQKNSIAIAFDHQIVASAHIGDLGSLEAMGYFERTINTFGKFYNFKPDSLAHDKHPNYATTKWALNYLKNIEKHSVQHHYAHMLAVMAEHSETGNTLSFVWDGTGYGDDGTIWGGEVLIGDTKSFKRVAHLRPFKLLGGDRAVKEPRRAALALLFELYRLKEILEMDNPTTRAFKKSEIKALHQAWSKGLNSPKTTSIGRVFDAIASLAGICQIASYEGESGLKIETAAALKGKINAVIDVKDDQIIDWEPLVRSIVENRESSPALALIEGLADTIKRISDKYDDTPIALCGGVFQNRTLLSAVIKRVKGRTLLLPKKMPVNDGSISLGQLWFTLHNID